MRSAGLPCKRPRRPGIRLAWALALMGAAWGEGDGPPPPLLPSIAVLNPVDVAAQAAKPRVGGWLRQSLARGGWQVVSGEGLEKRLRDLHVPSALLCKEFQCAFDAGNALQTEFVLFGTATALPELYAFTLNLLHVPTAQVVWAEAGEIPRGGPAGTSGWETRLERAAAGLHPSLLDLRKRPRRGTMAVMEAGAGSGHSRVLSERAATRVAGSRTYDLLGNGELHDLLQALEISGPEAPLDPQEMLALGRRLDVHYLLSSRLDREADRYRLQMTLYDIREGRTARQWPARPVADFRKLLRLEDRFLATLGDPVLPASAWSEPSRLRKWGRYASIGVAAATGLGLGYLALQTKREADNHYRDFRSALSEQEARTARDQVQQEDVVARRYGVLGGISLALGVAIWAF